MSEIIYNGTKVDSAIKQINTQLNSYDSIIDSVLSLTNSLVNIKGFDIIPEAAGVSSDTYSQGRTHLPRLSSGANDIRR